jgi:hypothetical protein
MWKVFSYIKLNDRLLTSIKQKTSHKERRRKDHYQLWNAFPLEAMSYLGWLFQRTKLACHDGGDS